MSKHAEVAKRRKQLCNLIFRGIPLTIISERLASEYDVKPSTIKNDWSRREEWIEDVFNVSLDNEKKLILDIISEIKEGNRLLWDIARNGDSDSAKIGAIKQIQKSNNNLLKMLQSLGFVDKEPDEIKVTDKKLEDYFE